LRADEARKVSARPLCRSTQRRCGRRAMHFVVFDAEE
jgi:hypothetical protein